MDFISFVLNLDTCNLRLLVFVSNNTVSFMFFTYSRFLLRDEGVIEHLKVDLIPKGTFYPHYRFIFKVKTIFLSQSIK